jgi:hypothetical protein
MTDSVVIVITIAFAWLKEKQGEKVFTMQNP